MIFLRKEINNQLDVMESLCCTDYDYKRAGEKIKSMRDEEFEELTDNVNKLNDFIKSNQF